MCRSPWCILLPTLAIAGLLLAPSAQAENPWVQCGERIDFGGLRERLRLAFGEDRAPVPGLFLSGGAAYGAWGAGVLYGRWLRRSDTPEEAREFRLVTGVSTGGLMSTLAFLGEQEDYDVLKDVYTNSNEGDVQKCSLFRALFGSGYCSRKPLRELAKRHLEERIKMRVARAEGELLLGTVDLNSGEFCVWDMKAVAEQADKEQAVEDYLDILMATANAPAIGTPVELENDKGERGLHVDGGVLRQVFAHKLARSLRCGGEDEDCARVDAHFLINGKLIHPFTKSVVRNRTIDLATRGLTLLEGGGMFPTVHFFKEFMQSERVWLSHLPQDYDVGFEKRQFEEEHMERLFEKGCAWGFGVAGWRTWNGGSFEPNQEVDFPDIELPSRCEAVEPPS